MSTKTPRINPTIWTTGVASLLSGDRHCEWSVWFRSRFQDYAQVPSDFDSITWRLNHTALLRRVVGDLEAAGYAVTTEDQNRFALTGTAGTLAGKPDIIAVRDGSGVIVDTKTGAPKLADSVQTMLYMWAVPKCLPQHQNVVFDGRVVYPTRSAVIPAVSIDAPFLARVRDVLQRVSREGHARKVPSFAGCRFCPLTAGDCPERLEADGAAGRAETDEF